jgi:uncharacterized membrane protein YraQ (UPF0718 family)
MRESAELGRARDEGDFSYVVTGFVVLVLVLCGLFYYKWGGAIRSVAGVRATGGWSGTADGLTTGGVLHASLFYFRRIWIALVYGLLIAATVRAYVSPRRVVALFDRGGPMRRQVAGGLMGAPLMLCSCCITPVFQSVYESGARLGSALAVMLASPGLNPAALMLTFLLFPVSLGVARVAAALAAVILLPPILEGFLGGPGVMPPRPAAAGDNDVPRSARETVERLAQALGHVFLRTIPLVIVGVLLSSVILPFSVRLSTGGTLLVVVLVAALAVLLALPTFFEIPLALIFLSVGTPGAAAAMLVAGPIVNLPSLLILARETRPKVALALALGVWLLAVLAGLSVSALV